MPHEISRRDFVSTAAITVAAALLAVLGGIALAQQSEQDKYTLKVPGRAFVR
jgi:hypothetical protein